MRREVLTWDDVDKLIDHLIPQFETEFEAMVVITHGGIVPGGILAEALKINDLFIASVDFPAEMEMEKQREIDAPAGLAQIPAVPGRIAARAGGASWWWTTCGARAAR